MMKLNSSPVKKVKKGRHNIDTNKKLQTGSEAVGLDKKKHKRFKTPKETTTEVKKHETPLSTRKKCKAVEGKNSDWSVEKRKRLKSKKRRGKYDKESIERIKKSVEAKKKKLMKSSEEEAKNKDTSVKMKRPRPRPKVRLESVDLKFEENDEMTEFEGFWVPKESSGRLNATREDLMKRGIDLEKVDRKMRQLARREHRQLKLKLIGAQTKQERRARERAEFLARQNQPRQRRSVPGRPCGLQLREGEQMARYQGFWVGPEAAGRLERLRAELTEAGQSEQEVARQVKRARRAEERRLKQSGKLQCHRCGARGHQTTDCTALQQATAESGGNMCFRCGSAAHRLANCPQKSAGGPLPFAVCFLCKNKGHMSRDCPQNIETEDQPSSGAAAAKSTTASNRSWQGWSHDQDKTEVKSMPASKRTVGIETSAKKPKHLRFD